MAVRISRTARPLIGLLVLLALLAGLMIATKTHRPRLGLDLQGGTTITLTAKNTSGGGQVDPTSLEQAREIIQNRVDSLGVGETQVTTSGDNQITVAVPNVGQDQLVQLVGTTALLTFRGVYAEQPVTPPAPAPSASPTASSSPTSNPTTSTSPGASVSESANAPGGAASPNATPTSSATGNGRPFPGLPPAPVTPPTPLPTVPGKGTPENKAINWQPDSNVEALFNAYQCGQPVHAVSDQPLITCNREKNAKYLLGPTLIDGNKLTGANAGVPQNQVNWVVDLSFNAEGAKTFETLTGLLATRQSPENQFAIVLDGDVVSAPQVTKAIPGGKAEISGNFSASSARELANVLKYGALPLAFEVSSVDNVSAILGGEQLHAGIIAGIIGLILVVGYCFLYYRGLGMVVVLSLVVAGCLTYAMMSLLGESVGFALNLPGIAGAIVAIGLTADSFVIFFERIRDEVRDGRSLRSSIETGWHRARKTVLVSDSVSLLSAVVLFILAIGEVKGFAFTLGLTTAIDIAVVFWFTKPMMSLLARTKFFGGGHRLSGLDPAHFGVTRLPMAGARSRARAAASRAGTGRDH